MILHMGPDSVDAREGGGSVRGNSTNPADTHSQQIYCTSQLSSAENAALADVGKLQLLDLLFICLMKHVRRNIGPLSDLWICALLPYCPVSARPTVAAPAGRVSFVVDAAQNALKRKRTAETARVRNKDKKSAIATRIKKVGFLSLRIKSPYVSIDQFCSAAAE